jgi:CubicO group peptidase (beta-lactamase class C family)
MHMKKFILCFLAALCLVVTQSGHASARTNDGVADIIKSFYSDNGLVGLSVSIHRNARTVTYSHGYANLESRDKVTKETVFRLASVSKLFTTLAILTLKERKELSVDDPVSKYVPDLPRGEDITIRNLLQHTSGVPDLFAVARFRDNQARGWKADELLEMLKAHLANKGLDFEPGTKAVYSNSNFVLLGLVVEAVSGMAFKDYVVRHVTAPLGMRHTGVGTDAGLVPHRAAGYEVDGGKVINAPFVSVVAPFGTGDFMSQTCELVKISRVFKPGTLLGRSTIDEMSRPVVLKDGSTWIGDSERLHYSFGFCWELIKPKENNDWIYTKSGAISGFLAYVLYFAKADVTVAISANTQGRFSLLALGLDIGEALGALR